MKNITLILTLIMCMSSFSLAQNYIEISEEGWGFGMDESKPAIVDLDHDGLYDLIIGTRYGRLHHFEQKSVGSTEFSLLSKNFNEIDLSSQSTPSFTDLDNDNLLDMIIGDDGGDLSHYEQDFVGSANFIWISDSLSGIHIDSQSSPCFTDLDHDDLLDMIVGDHSGKLHHYEQESTGSLTFALRSDNFNEIDAGGDSAPTFTDLDGDSLLDLVVGESAGRLRHFEQDDTGSVSFTMVDDRFGGIDIGSSSSPLFSDLDGNGLLDLVIGSEMGPLNHFEQDQTNSLNFGLITDNLLNNIDVGATAAPFFVDLDDDGRLDMVSGEDKGELRHYEQDAAGSIKMNLISNSLIGVDLGHFSKPLITDLNHNNLLDLIIGEKDNRLFYYEQDAIGLTTFTLISDGLNGVDVGEYPAPCIVDIDNDNLLDMIVGERYGNLYHYEQDSVGSITFNQISESFNEIDVGSFSVPAFTDLDGDSLLDLLVGELDGNLNHYEQDARGSFHFNLISENFHEIDVGQVSHPVFIDLNGDGFEDLLVGDNTGAIHYFQRDEETGVEEVSIGPLTVKLYQNYPNPFNPVTTIWYDLLQSADINISIYNMLGQKVKSLENGFRYAGTHLIQWHGDDEQGNLLASGIYICRIEAGKFRHSIEIVLLK